MKKITFILVMAFVAVRCMAYDCIVDGIYYNLNGSTAEVTSLIGEGWYHNLYSGSISIPESITYNNSTYLVTKVGYMTFYLCSGLTSVTIPSSVTSIGGSAFVGCSGLTSVTIPNSVTTIGERAFSGCGSLTSVTIPNSVTTIGERAFSGCRGLISISVDAGNTHYDSRNNCNAIIETSTNKLFVGCMNTVIPNGVTSIGGSAFVGCSGLTSISIPSSVTSIGEGAFYGCSGLTSMSVDAGNTHYDSRNNCNAIIETSTNELIAGCGNTVIPNSVTSIGANAFYGCSGLTSVTIPNSVTTIGESAFSGCGSLISVTIPASVTSIGLGAFSGCSSLTSLTINGGTIGEYAFFDCSSLTSLTINGGIIGERAFWGYNSLTSLTINGGTIGKYAFFDCSGLTSVTIPASVTSIGSGAFSSCSGLISISVDAGNTRYDSRNNCNAIIETSTNKLIAGCKNTVIPNNVTTIGEYAFCGCSGLTSVTIPNSVTSIGGYAFYGCKGLTSVTIPNSVTSISWGDGYYYYGAFDSCASLTSVTIPKVAMPMDNKFKGCPIANVTIADGVDIICDNAFRGWSTINTVTIPQSVSSVGERIFEGCTGLTTITVDENNTYIDSRDSCNAIIETATNQLIAGCVTTVIPRSVKSIRDYAFYDCIGLTSVNIPDSVTSIGDYAFANCSNITDIACHAVTPPTIKSNTFTDYNPTLYVPLGSVSLYSAKAYWKNFFIQPIPGVSHAITVTSNDSLMGTTLGSGTYEENTNAQLVAVTQAGYSFQQWSDGNTDNPRNVVVTSDSTFTAEFTVAGGVNDTIYLEYDGKDAMQYSLEDYGVYYFGGRVYNPNNLYIKLYYSDGKLLSSGTNDIDISYYATGIYIVTDGKGGFLKINHYR